jgi:hypothetical protein
MRLYHDNSMLIIALMTTGLNKKESHLIGVSATCRLSWVAESVECPINLSNDVRSAPGDAFVGDVICTGRQAPEGKTKLYRTHN